MAMEFAWHSNGRGTLALKDADGTELGTVSIGVTMWTARVAGLDPERFTDSQDAQRWVEAQLTAKMARTEDD